MAVFHAASARGLLRSECLYDGVDVVLDHFGVGINRGSIGDEWTGELDAGVLGDGAENFRVGFFFGENGTHLMFFEIVDQFA